MNIHVITLFPEIFQGFLDVSFISRAQKQGVLKVSFYSPREFGIGVHKSVDDTPYGGGSGMVMRVDVMHACIMHVEEQIKHAGFQGAPHRVLLSPQGVCFSQSKAHELSQKEDLIFICGRYEGFDERLSSYVDEEISLGDFVMTGGEVAVMAIMEALVRLLPGVLGNSHSAVEESHASGLLEYPQYTRPEVFLGEKIPEVLRSGHHENIATWREDEALKKTLARRPDLYASYMDKHPEVLLKKAKQEQKLQRKKQKQEKMEQVALLKAEERVHKNEKP